MMQDYALLPVSARLCCMLSYADGSGKWIMMTYYCCTLHGEAEIKLGGYGLTIFSKAGEVRSMQHFL